MANASVTITGTADAPIFNFDIPQGEKGEPGGLTLGMDLGAIDLNTILASGTYRQSSAANVTSALNYPSQVLNQGGCLVVLERVVNTTVLQIWHPILRPELTLKRVYSSGTWTGWKAHASQRVDQTAGRVVYTWDDTNAREQLIHGDTGWRDIGASLLNGWVGQSVLMRRVNYTVHFKTLNLDAAAATNDIFFLPPAGFTRPYGSTILPFAKSGTTSTVLTLASGGMAFGGRTGKYGDAAWSETSWLTNDVWPTTLPGIASGTIANL